jgi:hypothetical protein
VAESSKLEELQYILQHITNDRMFRIELSNKYEL